MAGKKRGPQKNNQQAVDVSSSDSERREPIETVTDTHTEPVPPEVYRTRLRARWELASVLNFLRVSKPLLQSKLEISAVEIETALINPNQDLSDLHILLLKGIPPVTKNLAGPDAWVTVMYKKIAPWWPWVAAGESPLKASNGEEISSYRKLDPVNRLVILKSLCEIRALQDDFVSYIGDALKQGTDVRFFRKERICGDNTGIAYWNDGDDILGYRLYREVTKVDYTPRKGKGRLTPPPDCYQWETLATNLEEFQEISDKFSSSEFVAEATVGEIVKNEIIPILEEIQKKKERALKRQQKQAMLLNGYMNSHVLGATRSCRNRKPVKYTFEEYDKTIEEAIHLTKKRKTTPEPKQGQKVVKDEGGKHVNSNGNSRNDVMEQDIDEDDDKFRGSGDDSDSERAGTDSESESERGNDDSESNKGDEDYDDKSNGDNENDEQDHETEEEDHDNESEEEGHDSETDEEDQDNGRKGKLVNSKKENKIHGRETRANGHARNVSGLRRSNRVTENGDHAKMKKQTSDTSESDSETDSDSDSDADDGSQGNISNEETSDAGKGTLDVLDGLLEESEEEEEENDSDEETN